MRFLIHGNAPTVKTGYGVQGAYLAEHLRDAGHEVAFSNTYGVQGSIQSWHGIRIYPQGIDYQGNDVLHLHAGHFFEGADPEDCWIVVLTDVWALTTPMLQDFNVMSWVPIDHLPAPPAVLEFFRNSGAIPIAMSRFGEQMLTVKGYDPVYIPLSVDTQIFKPTRLIDYNGVTLSGRELMGVPDDKFIVGMVAMNKGWAKDRKGFNEAFQAFGHFVEDHPDAVLYVHSEKFGGAEGIDLKVLAAHAGISDANLVWADQYAYRVGYTPEMMAAVYTAMDVLLAPSHGEGFCVPLIEAQACGTPVIATNFSAQAELIGPGWAVFGQAEYDPPHHSSYMVPFIHHIVALLEEAVAEGGLSRSTRALESVNFASNYDTNVIFDAYWKPFLESLKPVRKTELRERMPDKDAVAVLCPVLNRPENVAPLVESFVKNNTDQGAALYFICDKDDEAEIAAVTEAYATQPAVFLRFSERGSTFAEKGNSGYSQTAEPWLLLIGDDVRFHEGWLDAARKLSDRYDVIGTNDSTGETGNPRVKTGAHADHFFVRRAYVEEEGACLDGPGVLAPEAYKHWYVDMEIVGLAKARGVFTPCLDSVVEHLHPGYKGREDLRQSDPTYMLAVKHSAEDEETFKDRLPLIQQQRRRVA